MTLTEYKNQETPARMPSVILKDKEYTIINQLKVKGFLGEIVNHSHIQIEGIDFTYLLIGDIGTLRTTDKDGNKKGYSCFQISRLKKTFSFPESCSHE